MIEKLRLNETSKAVSLSFRWQGTTISLVLMSGLGDRKCLTAKPDDAGAVELTTDGTTAIWIISSADVDRSAAGASTTSDGAVPSATSSDTEDTPDSTSNPGHGSSKT